MNVPELASAIERLEAHHLTLYARGGGEVLDLGGVRAVYCGEGMPINVGIGFGSGAESAACLPEVEAFLGARGTAPTVVAFSHLAPELMQALGERRYRLTRVLHVYALGLNTEIPAPTLPVRLTDPDEWLRGAVLAFGEDSRRIMALTAARPETTLWVCGEDELLGVGALTVGDNLALLFSAGTRPDARKRGVQTALLAARLNYARQEGATFAAVMTSPGSASERNVLRTGFSPVCARLSFMQGQRT